jgi:hypothetical protein
MERRTYQFSLGSLWITVQSAETAVIEQWHTFLGGCWQTTVSAPADITLTCTLADTLPAWPSAFDFQHSLSGLGVVQRDGETHYYFASGAYGHDAHHAEITLQISPQALPELETITYILLSAPCRRLNHFLIHAFAATKNDQAVLLVAPSGGGKTTTGLSLLLSGYGLLANDTAVLEHHANKIIVHPTPETMRIREGTYQLLDSLHELSFARDAAAPLTAVYFLDLVPDQPCACRPIPKAIALAKLLEASVDRWDRQTVSGQITFWERVCAETAVYTLQIGHDVAQVAQTLQDIK